MNEIVLISSYTPTTEKENILRELVYKLHDLNYKIALSSHSIIPTDISNKCDFIFYEKENKLIYDPEIKYWYTSILKNSAVSFKFKPYNSMATHILPIMSMLYGSLQFLNALNYDIIHYIEYDTKLIDDTSLQYNKELLKTYDSISYYTEKLNNKNSFYMGHLFSFNLSKLNIKKIKYEENELLLTYKEYFNTTSNHITEKIIYDLLFKELNTNWVLLSDFESSFELDLSDKVNSYVTEHLTFNVVNNILHFFSDNKTNYKKNITIIINDILVTNLSQNPHTWNWISLKENINNIKLIKLFVDDKLIKSFNMDTQTDYDYIVKWSKVIY
jgi:hypothetical protein